MVLKWEGSSCTFLVLYRANFRSKLDYGCVWHSDKYQSTTTGQHPQLAIPPGTHDYEPKRHNLTEGVRKCMIFKQETQPKFNQYRETPGFHDKVYTDGFKMNERVKVIAVISRHMMTSSNGNIFCVTVPLRREFTGYRWIPRTKACDAELWCFYWSAPEKNGWVNNRKAGDLRRHLAHYDVSVMISRMVW